MYVHYPSLLQYNCGLVRRVSVALEDGGLIRTQLSSANYTSVWSLFGHWLPLLTVFF